MDMLTLTAGGPAGSAETPLRKREFRAMGSQMMAAIHTPALLGEVMLAQVPDWFEGWEQQLSRFRPDSELSRLNRTPGQAVPVSAEFWEVLELALAAADETAGLVTPAVLNALEAAGYDRTFEVLRVSQPDAGAAGNAPVIVPDWHAIAVDPQHRTVRVPPGMRLDFGGIAKGWAADRAAARLGRVGPALVDAGGDIAVSGPMADGEPWPIGVANPVAPDEQLALLRIAGGGVATSGRDYHRWRHQGAEAHHIIDPRTAAPAATDVLSVTVIAPSTAQAEAAAKTALILGSRAGLRWIDARRELAALLVLEDGRTLPSQAFPAFLWE